MIKKCKNAEHISLETTDKLLKHKNAVMLFMSSKEIYVMEEKYEKLLKEQKN